MDNATRLLRPLASAPFSGRLRIARVFLIRALMLFGASHLAFFYENPSASLRFWPEVVGLLIEMAIAVFRRMGTQDGPSYLPGLLICGTMFMQPISFVIAPLIVGWLHCSAWWRWFVRIFALGSLAGLTCLVLSPTKPSQPIHLTLVCLFAAFGCQIIGLFLIPKAVHPILTLASRRDRPWGTT